MASDYEVFCNFIEQREAERAWACKCQPIIFSKKDMATAFRKGMLPWDGYGWLYRKVMIDRLLSGNEVKITDSTIKVEGQVIICTHLRAGVRRFTPPGQTNCFGSSQLGDQGRR